MEKYYLISYGWHYGNSGSASHGTTVTSKTPIEFISDKMVDAMRENDTENNSFHITTAIEITKEEYENWYKRH